MLSDRALNIIIAVLAVVLVTALATKFSWPDNNNNNNNKPTTGLAVKSKTAIMIMI